MRRQVTTWAAEKWQGTIVPAMPHAVRTVVTAPAKPEQGNAIDTD